MLTVFCPKKERERQSLSLSRLRYFVTVLRTMTPDHYKN
jgi:hypothetical protein